MAQRFGGQHSPGATGRSAQAPTLKKPQTRRARANLLALAGVPLLFTAFGDGPFGLAIHLAAFASIAGGAWLTREGLEAQEAFEARKIAKRPAVPRKILGGVAVGIGVGLATFDGGLLNALLYGAIVTALHATAFGLDPLKDKGVDGADGFQSDRVAKAVEEAEANLQQMLKAIEDTRDRHLIARVERFQSTARTMFRSVENDPRDLSAVRKFLGVYLLGARDAALKFTDLYMSNQDQKAKADFTALLDDLEENFTAKTGEMMNNNRTDLNIEIDVLRDRLRREGVTLK